MHWLAKPEPMTRASGGACACMPFIYCAHAWRSDLRAARRRRRRRSFFSGSLSSHPIRKWRVNATTRSLITESVTVCTKLLCMSVRCEHLIIIWLKPRGITDTQQSQRPSSLVANKTRTKQEKEKEGDFPTHTKQHLPHKTQYRHSDTSKPTNPEAGRSKKYVQRGFITCVAYCMQTFIHSSFRSMYL